MTSTSRCSKCRRAADAVKAQVVDDDQEEADEQAGRPGTAQQVSTQESDVGTDGGTLVKGAWVVSENPRILYFPHVKPRSRYVIRISAGLASASGDKLSADGRYSVLTATLSPAYFFPSLGMVLPAHQNGGLPVTTANVPEVDIQFLRVKPDQLPRFLDKVIGASRKVQARQGVDDTEGAGDVGADWRASNLKGAISNWSLDAISKLTDSVFVGRFLTEQKPNKRSVTFIPVEEIKELREPGIYIAVMSQPNRFRHDFQVTYFYVSDLGLSARLFAKGADVYVSSLTGGQAVAGVEVAWVDESSKVLARSETDGDGRANFAAATCRRQGCRGAAPAADLDDHTQRASPRFVGVRDHRSSRAPGAAFRLLRSRSVPPRRTVGRLGVLPVTGTADQYHRSPSKRFCAVLMAKVTSVPAGNPTPKWAAITNAVSNCQPMRPRVSWTLELRADPADKLATTSYRFGVEEFLPERMKLDLSSKQATLSANDTLHIGVKGSYLYGAPASGNQLLGVAVFERRKNRCPASFLASSSVTPMKKQRASVSSLRATNSMKTVNSISK